ncbi:MAG TPA: SMP-30/gluconolactonase/LRE family protein [Candidatus Nanopelagicaceae bacterium]|nr:SMP-30/gluconolactonase/LRE family protein [Candidatus Nanopelagicaceae bacterium]
MSKRIILKTEILLEGLKFPESPRWHDNKLWFVDMESYKVMTVELNGNNKVILERPNQVSGLGWLPDNRLLVVSMGDNRLLRLDPDGLNVVVDLNRFGTVLCNDMVVDKKGRAYIGNFGFDYLNGEPFAPTKLILVNPNGEARVVADNMAFPNGIVITPDDQTLVIAETFAARLTAFDIKEDGSLTKRRVWANLKSLAPDGICLDQDGGIWVAAPGRGRVVRVLEGGLITHIVRVENDAYACMLGGPDRKTLFVATSKHTRDAGRIEFVEVDIPGAGLP